MKNTKAKNLFVSIALHLLMVGGANAQKDSLRVLTLDAFFQIVQEHHPISLQGDLFLDEGNFNVLNARGGFDPKVFTSVDQKQFGGDQYYTILDAGFKFPTWLGIDAQIGYEQTGGSYLNPERYLPENGLYYAGLSIPLGRGLIIDKRRAELQRAQIFQKASEVQRQSILNELLYEAGKAYWDWFAAYHIMEVYKDALDLAIQRFEAIRRGASLGDLPAIDTLEAGIQVQNRKLTLNQAILEYNNATTFLSVFLWLDGSVPIETSEDTVPVNFDSIFSDKDNLPRDLEVIKDHPELRNYQLKVDQLLVDERWKKEQLKPLLDVKYNALVGNLSGSETGINMNNFKWGFQFGMPVFLRKERSALALTRLKIKQTKLEFSTKQAEIGFKARAALNDWNATSEQMEVSTKIVEDYFSLLQGEKRMFEGGESSLFMVNSRELGYINAQVKLIDVTSKNQKAALATNYAMGVLYQN